ncbi:MAG: hypothetical protein M1541_18745 [Acidobacteria bacterium]|nr:hypothetical protein [Acidobacteriota bacterium]
MSGWFRKWLGGPGTPLRGGPVTPRLKTYSSQTGYVYRYLYRGNRKTRRKGEDATEYAFDVSAGSLSGLNVSVVVPASSLQPSQSTLGRLLAENERYAIAKMALFQAFDERPGPAAMRDEVLVRASDAAAILATIGLA